MTLSPPSPAPAGGTRVVVGMSGGVDSAVAAALLQEAGYDVIGVTLILWKDEGEEKKRWQDRSCCKVGLARHVAKTLSIPHHTIDLQDIFSARVIDNFCDAYVTGETPNPCIQCNARVKFSHLRQLADRFGADYLATGHYCRVRRLPGTGRYALLKGIAREKDQSYFLYRLNQDQLSRTLFPVGGMTKEAVYQKAEALGLPYEEVLESQEVCFVTQKDYRGFLAARRPAAVAPGEIVTAGGRVVGRHDGIAFFTIGQRRRLGVALGERAYVTRLDPGRRRVVVGAEDALHQTTLTAGDPVWGGEGRPDRPVQVTAKVRYRAEEAAARLTPLEGDRLRLDFTAPQRGIAPGQAVVCYRGALVIGGGTIRQPD